MKPTALLILAAFIALTACQSIPDSRGAAEEFGGEAAAILKDYPEAVLALTDLDTQEIPETLSGLFREELSTALVTAFREDGVKVRVVTRDRVDSILREQSLELEGLTYGEAQLQMGQLLGADLLVTGTLAWLEDDIYQFSGQIIETDTGTVIGGYSRDFLFDTESSD